MIHLTVQQLSSYLDGQLVGSASDNVQSHLAACRDCATRFALLERIDGILSRALSIEPGEEFFRELEAEVGSRIRERGQRDRDLSAPTVTSVRFLQGPSQPRAADIRATTTQPVARAMSSPPVRPPRAALPRRSGPSPTWLVIGTLAVVAGSAGVVVSRTPLVSSWITPHLSLGPAERSVASRALSPSVPSDTAADEATQALEPTEAATPQSNTASREWNPWEPPTTRSSTADDEMAPDAETTSDDPADRPEPSTMRGDEILASPDSSRRSRSSATDPFRALGGESLGPIRAAQQLSEMADADPTAARFETAATGWERALDTMGGVPEQVSVRQLLADARYRAWQAEPTAARAEAAKAAIRTYLLFAPSGWERAQAKGRLTRLGG